MAENDAPSLTPGQVKGIIIRGRWWIVMALFTVAIAATGVAYLLPVQFTSEATIVVVQQQVPQRYVTPTSTLSIADELQAMTQEVLSRKRLLELIEQFGLYAKERRRLAPEQIIGLMRKHIEIEPIEGTPGAGGKDFNAFKISFSADTAILAQEVTSQLTSLFIQESLKVRGEQATTTTNFLRERLEASKNNLAEQEEHLRDFKMKYLGELPEQQQSNLAILTSAQAQLQNTTASLDRARQQRVYLASMIDGYRRLISRGAALPGTGSPETAHVNNPIQTLQADLTRLQTTRSQLVSIYREHYPDVVAIDREILAKQELLQRLKAAPAARRPDGATPAGTPDAGPDAPMVSQNKNAPAETEEDTSIAQLKSQLEANRLEMENLSNDEKHQNATILEYQSRLNLTPVREQQLSGILRDYELSKQEYLDLLGKEQQSQLAMSLEQRQGGQQFRLSEAPNLPILPSSPKRLKIALGGAGGGIFLGLVLAVFTDVVNPKFYDEKEVTRRLAIPLVVGLPVLLSPREARRRRWKRVFDWLGTGVLTIAVVAAEYYVYRHP